MVLLRRRHKKPGLPPGSLVYVGEKREGPARIKAIDYSQSGYDEHEVSAPEECARFRDPSTVTWIDVTGVHDVDVVERLGGCFGIHPLVLEDIVHPGQRPKMEEYDDQLFVVLNMIYYSGPGEEDMSVEQVSLVLGPGFVLSFQEEEGDVFGPVRARLAGGKGRIRQRGADYLAYALIDAVVDHYFAVLEKNGDWVEEVEDELLEDPGPATLAEIHGLKRDMLFLRRSVWPLREVVSGLSRGETPLVEESTRVYLRDVHDHTMQVVDSIETFRDMLSGMLDIYLSSVSNRMNEIMKVLTVIATLFIPLTFIAGVYGMNFAGMPELSWRWGYPAVLALMAVMAGGMLLYFRRKGWF